MTVAEHRLNATGLCRVFKGGAGIHEVDLDVAAGEVHALVGLNGAGKTTLMRLLLGMLHPGTGAVRIVGHDLPATDPTLWSRVGHLVEHPFAYPELDCQTNLALAARLQGIPRRQVEAVVEAGIVELDLVPYAQTRASVLSSGNRQRLGLAAALAHHPDLILLDEPTNALDPRGVILLREVLLERARQGAGILVSSHYLDEVARIADRITVINQGRTIGTLTPAGSDIERAFFALVEADEEAHMLEAT